MAEIRVVAITLDTRGARVEFDKPIKNYFEHIPGGQWHKKSMTAMAFPWQFDPEDILDKIVRQSRKKVNNLTVHTDMVVVVRRAFYARMHMSSRRRIGRRFNKISKITTTITREKKTPRRLS